MISWDYQLDKNNVIENLGTVAEREYYTFNFPIIGNAAPVTFKVIAGELPPGTQVDETQGKLFGFPIVTDVDRDITDRAIDSTSTVSIGLGIKEFLIGKGLDLSTQDTVRAFYDANNYIIGTINKYVPNTGLLVINPTEIKGQGRYSFWKIALLTSNLADTNRTFTFTVRASDGASIADKTFSLSINNLRPPIILPRSTTGTVNLGIYASGSYIDYQFVAVEDNPSANLLWKVSSGSSPQFLTESLTEVSLKIGNKVLAVDKDLELSNQDIVKILYDNNNYMIADVIGYSPSTGTLTVNATQVVGTGNFSHWKITLLGTTLPSGLTLSEDGKLSGYLLPNPPLNRSDKGRWDNSYWDENLPGDGIIPWDFVGLRVARTFQFTISVFDGISYDYVTYIMTVLPKEAFTADTTVYSANLIHVTTDMSNKHKPIILNTSYFLPATRQLSFYAYKFNGVDFDGDQIKYVLTTTTLGRFDEAIFDSVPFDSGVQSFPPSLYIDEDTGWLYGTLAEQIEEEIFYSFQIYAYKVGNPAIRSDTRTYSLRVLGNLIDLIEWSTSSDLGTIDNQEISEFKLDTKVYDPVLRDYLFAANLSNLAVSPNVSTVTYTVQSGSLPAGLELQSNGLITGRAGFDYFRLDHGSTTIDNNITDFDTKYTFTANAIGFDSNANVVVSTLKDFVITVNNINEEPYSDIFSYAYLPQNQRDWLLNLINNNDIFPDNIIYRSNDPHFGRASNIKVLLNPGIETTSNYQMALGMQKNHYAKKVLFGDIKTAVAVDDNYNTKYEVVYAELIDEFEYNSKSVKHSTDLTLKVQQGYLTQNRDKAINEPSTYQVTEYKVLYPNSFEAMHNNLIDKVNYINKTSMPDWMSSVQPDGSTIGFKRVFVFCYLSPNTEKFPKFNSEMVASRLRKYLKDNQTSLNRLEFIIDRYQIDLNLESYPNTNDKYLSFPSLGVFN